jgi:copper chaperone CopZ
MCKERIENAIDVKGVKFADWSSKTNICKVTYNSSKITEKEIHKILANAGHDTKECRSPDAAYSNLHSCCQYERAEVSK